MFGVNVFLLVMRRMRLRDVKKLTPGHTASKWQNWDFNLEPSDCKVYVDKIDSWFSLRSRGCLTLGVQSICLVDDRIFARLFELHDLSWDESVLNWLVAERYAGMRGKWAVDDTNLVISILASRLC